MNEFHQKFFDLAGRAQRVLLSTHRDPDGDAIASLLAAYFLLIQKFPDKVIKMMVSSPINDRFKAFANFDKIESVADISDHLDEFDLLVFVDANFSGRFTDKVDHLNEFRGLKIAIDHHPYKNERFDLMLFDEQATSVSEIIYFNLLDLSQAVPAELCKILLMGLLADTGGLRYVRPDHAQVYGMAEKLVRDGNIHVDELSSSINSYSQRVFLILQELIRNSRIKQIGDWPPFLYSFIAPAFVSSGGFTILETEEASGVFTDFLRSIDESSWGFVARNYGTTVKVSFRSRPGSVDVRRLTENLDRGSGHPHSAGAKYENADSREVVKNILLWLSQNSAELAP
ncbi:MAG: hypothetical protein A3J48_03055 [Candidatus Doudnabacteria bacterium RIFCSPHIGHO2_02_FULL_46_11]|uniref:DDH domain-containing protein n=1 Tax=Candidatus Doudnabacteria bacterium RIFCSPHIGHO2_02_FULL_46_11 TaxID=1817832 RepID=A0A1F5P5I3_9BACT|nr:MAG: hypothetical protein A3J48_03055 [Candidatus Doudnabacteria bacterium RIFCSPHIGHO2_02_FULL_46_11]